MFPEICRIGPLTVYSYGFMLAVAVMICSLLLSRDAKILNVSVEEILDLVFYSVFSGILGARLFYVLLEFDEFFRTPMEIFMLQKGGLAWQGGLCFGAFTAFWYIRKKKFPLFATIDLIAPYIALGHAIGRIGCFLNGCCYGKHVSWGVYFPVHQDTLHPTQLYSFVALFFVYLILKKIQKNNQIPGRIFAWYLILAASQRFIIEFFRDSHYPVFLGMSIFQYVSIGIAVVGWGFYRYVDKRN